MLKFSAINPSYYLSNGAVRHYWFPPPIGLVYVASAAKAAGFDVNCVDAIGEDIYGVNPHDKNFSSVGLTQEAIVRRVGAHRDVIGVSCMFSNNWRFYRMLLRKLRAAYPDAVIVAGGEHVTALPEYVLRDAGGAVDYCILGEGEETVVDLLRSLEAHGRERVHEVQGVAGLRGDAYFETRRARTRAVDTIPKPDWDMIPIENYLGSATGQTSNGYRTMPIVASRGCPYKCSFCSNPNMWGNLWRPRRPEDVVAEIEDYQRRYRVDAIEFFDLTAIVNKSWTVKFCNLVRERGLKVRLALPTGTRSEALDEEALAGLHSAGCAHLTYAPESGSEATLERIHKNINLDRVFLSMQAAIRLGFTTKANIIVGSLDETHADVRDTLRFIFKCAWHGLKDIVVLPMTPYPGSEDFTRAVADGVFPKPVPGDDAFLSRIEDNLYNNPFSLRSYTRHISAPALWFYVYGGLALFYMTAYLRHPRRIWMTLCNILAGRQDGFLERAIYLIPKALMLRLRGRMAPVRKGFTGAPVVQA